MPENPLAILPAKVRLYCYLAYFLLALAFTAIGAYFIALKQPVPDWCIGGAAALVPIGAAFAAVAASNTTRNTAANTAVVTAPASVNLELADSSQAPVADLPADPTAGTPLVRPTSP